MNNLPNFEIDDTLRISDETKSEVLAELAERLKENYPYGHPLYAGQMLKPPVSIAMSAYYMTMHINPNNHALDGGRATSKMEVEVIAEFARMFGYKDYLGHLTSSGTIANLEALWVARRLHPKKAIAFSSQAHYTHERMCEVIGAKALKIEVDGTGRMDLEILRNELKAGKIGTIVVTTGTTGLGAVDQLDKIVELRKEFEFRIHIDGAYGGYFRLLADESELMGEAAAAYRLYPEADSIVIDPHKHGLQPYGCGCVIFRDPELVRFYKHDSPFTYFTSKDLHLGEISLECSRAGAAAAALWATLKCFPLASNKGMGPILKKTRNAALKWYSLVEQSEQLRPMLKPQLDILNFYSTSDGLKASQISAHTERVFTELMNDPVHPIFLAKFTAQQNLFKAHTDLIWDQPYITVFRSVLMKPEHLDYVRILHSAFISKA